jgi:hypothetical protein
MLPVSTNLNAPVYSRVGRKESEPSWVFPAIAISCGYFICLLILAMFFDRSVRVLHPFQALIYVGVVYLAQRQSALGFGAGCLIAAFWNYIFLVGARKDIWTFLTSGTGGIFVPLQLSGVVAHFVLIAACVVGFRCLSPHRGRWAAFFAGGAIAIGVLIALIDALRPQSMALLRSCFGL